MIGASDRTQSMPVLSTRVKYRSGVAAKPVSSESICVLQIHWSKAVGESRQRKALSVTVTPETTATQVLEQALAMASTAGEPCRRPAGAYELQYKKIKSRWPLISRILPPYRSKVIKGHVLRPDECPVMVADWFGKGFQFTVARNKAFFARKSDLKLGYNTTGPAPVVQRTSKSLVMPRSHGIPLGTVAEVDSPTRWPKKGKTSASGSAVFKLPPPPAATPHGGAPALSGIVNTPITPLTAPSQRNALHNETANPMQGDLLVLQSLLGVPATGNRTKRTPPAEAVFDASAAVAAAASPPALDFAMTPSKVFEESENFVMEDGRAEPCRPKLFLDSSIAEADACEESNKSTYDDVVVATTAQSLKDIHDPYAEAFATPSGHDDRRDEYLSVRDEAHLSNVDCQRSDVTSLEYEGVINPWVCNHSPETRIGSSKVELAQDSFGIEKPFSPSTSRLSPWTQAWAARTPARNNRRPSSLASEAVLPQDTPLVSAIDLAISELSVSDISVADDTAEIMAGLGGPTPSPVLQCNADVGSIAEFLALETTAAEAHASRDEDMPITTGSEHELSCLLSTNFGAPTKPSVHMPRLHTSTVHAEPSKAATADASTPDVQPPPPTYPWSAFKVNQARFDKFSTGPERPHPQLVGRAASSMALMRTTARLPPPPPPVIRAASSMALMNTKPRPPPPSPPSSLEPAIEQMKATASICPQPSMMTDAAEGMEAQNNRSILTMIQEDSVAATSTPVQVVRELSPIPACPATAARPPIPDEPLPETPATNAMVQQTSTNTKPASRIPHPVASFARNFASPRSAVSTSMLEASLILDGSLSRVRQKVSWTPVGAEMIDHVENSFACDESVYDDYAIQSHTLVNTRSPSLKNFTHELSSADTKTGLQIAEAEHKKQVSFEELGSSLQTSPRPKNNVTRNDPKPSSNNKSEITRSTTNGSPLHTMTTPTPTGPQLDLTPKQAKVAAAIAEMRERRAAKAARVAAIKATAIEKKAAATLAAERLRVANEIAAESRAQLNAAKADEIIQLQTCTEAKKHPTPVDSVDSEHTVVEQQAADAATSVAAEALVAIASSASMSLKKKKVPPPVAPRKNKAKAAASSFRRDTTSSPRPKKPSIRVYQDPPGTKPAFRSSPRSITPVRKVLERVNRSGRHKSPLSAAAESANVTPSTLKSMLKPLEVVRRTPLSEHNALNGMNRAFDLKKTGISLQTPPAAEKQCSQTEDEERSPYVVNDPLDTVGCGLRPTGRFSRNRGSLTPKRMSIAERRKEERKNKQGSPHPELMSVSEKLMIWSR